MPTSTLRLGDGESAQVQIAKAMREAMMPMVIVISGPNVGQRVRLEGTTVVGRDPMAGLCLTDPIVSFRHANFEDRGDAWALLDNTSTNGTFVNGKRITEHVLHDGDRIGMGTTVLRFEVHDPIEQAYDEELNRMLNVDELSGLWVRRRFDQELTRLLSACENNRSTAAVIVMDLDGVKKINDKHGHLFGAYVIGAAGKIIGRLLEARGPGSVGSRFGGDEYIAALSEASVVQAEAFAADVLRAVGEYPFVYEGQTLQVGISIGFAMYPENGKTVDELFHAADAAMYRAKQGGRNRVSR